VVCSYEGVLLCYVGHPRLSCTFERTNMQLVFEEAQEVAVLRRLDFRGVSSITKGELVCQTSELNTVFLYSLLRLREFWVRIHSSQCSAREQEIAYIVGR
jgi:hypothetical protein